MFQVIQGVNEPTNLVAGDVPEAGKVEYGGGEGGSRCQTVDGKGIVDVFIKS